MSDLYIDDTPPLYIRQNNATALPGGGVTRQHLPVAARKPWWRACDGLALSGCVPVGEPDYFDD